MKPLFVTIALMAAEPSRSCNQVTYDAIYENIIKTAIECNRKALKDNSLELDSKKEKVHKAGYEKYSSAEKKCFEDRNNAIEAVRSLCNGQKSTYEQN